ncbi:MAG: TIGR02587 family membrane protein, partial [Burkholderiales bacterium]
MTSESRHFARGLARAFGGATIFALPLLMTEEMWNFGLYVNPLKLAVLLVLSFPLFVGLSHHAGFEETFDWKEDVRDTCVAYAVAFAAAATVLTLISIVTLSAPFEHITRMLSLQVIPAGIGALLGRSLLEKKDLREQASGPQGRYLSKIFLMLAGALFLGITIAPTDEVIILVHQATVWHAIALALMSLTLMHAFVYAVEFKGGAVAPEGSSPWSLFLRFSVVGYALALCVSAYL